MTTHRSPWLGHICAKIASLLVLGLLNPAQSQSAPFTFDGLPDEDFDEPLSFIDVNGLTSEESAPDNTFKMNYDFRPWGDDDHRFDRALERGGSPDYHLIDPSEVRTYFDSAERRMLEEQAFFATYDDGHSIYEYWNSTSVQAAEKLGPLGAAVWCAATKDCSATNQAIGTFLMSNLHYVAYPVVSYGRSLADPVLRSVIREYVESGVIQPRQEITPWVAPIQDDAARLLLQYSGQMMMLTP